jgi:hypothetical protein|tara:strand:+ start:94 stop:333 length:240 start_codon:yes stop_codon:yes gene_type:complete
MKKTITLLEKQHDVLADVIRWLDENKFSNTDIRSKVDVVLNHSDYYEIKATQEDQEFIISEDKKLIRSLVNVHRKRAEI